MKEWYKCMGTGDRLLGSAWVKGRGDTYKGNAVVGLLQATLNQHKEVN